MTEEQVRRQMLARVATNDYTMVGVQAASRGEWVLPGFVYSVGLWTFRQVPEVIVVGAPAGHAVEWIERYAELVAKGRRFDAGQWSEEFLPDSPVGFEQVAPSCYRRWFAQAFHLYPDGDFPALQLLWPDCDGNWPWQRHWQRVNPEPQPVLTESGRPESFRVRR